MKLLEYWPPYERELWELRAIAEAEQPEMDAVALAVKDAPKDFFLMTLTDRGIARWESILEITPFPDETEEERWFTVYTRLIEMLPFTLTMLEQQLALLCGPEGYSVSLDHNEYLLSVLVALTARNNYTAVNDLLNRIVPANMIIYLSLKYNRHETLAKLTHAQLAAYTHNQLRNEVLT